MFSSVIALFERMKYKRFILVGVAFLVWMTFFDKSRWPVQMKLVKVIDQMEAEIDDYHEKIIKAKADKIDLENNLEKYAREKYYMHKPGEEVYIIEKVDKK